MLLARRPSLAALPPGLPAELLRRSSENCFLDGLM
jgi:hypothetical protein